MRAIDLLRLMDAHLSLLSRKVTRIDVSQMVVNLGMWRRMAVDFGDTHVTPDAALAFLSLGWEDPIPGFCYCLWIRYTYLLCLLLVKVEE